MLENKQGSWLRERLEAQVFTSRNICGVNPTKFSSRLSAMSFMQISSQSPVLSNLKSTCARSQSSRYCLQVAFQDLWAARQENL